MKKTLQINRRGVIVLSPDQATDHQCVISGHRLYYYDCKIALTNPVLDERGFIADHEEINQLIQELCKGPMPSCELIAETIAEKVSQFLINKKMRHDSVYVRMSGVPDNPTAFMEAWVYPEESDYDTKEEEKGPIMSEWRVMTREELAASTARRGLYWTEEIREEDFGRVLTVEELDHLMTKGQKSGVKGTVDFPQHYYATMPYDYRLATYWLKRVGNPTEAIEDRPWRIKTREEMEADGAEMRPSGDIRYPANTFVSAMAFTHGQLVPKKHLAALLKGEAVAIRDTEFEDNLGSSKTAWSYWKDIITDKPLPVLEEVLVIEDYAVLAANEDNEVKLSTGGILPWNRKTGAFYYSIEMGESVARRELTSTEAAILEAEGKVMLNDVPRYTIEKWMTKTVTRVKK